MKKKPIQDTKYTMKEYIKTWGVEDDFFTIRNGFLKGDKIYHSKVGMKDGKVGLISDTGLLKKFFKKETFLPFEILFPTNKKIYISYCDGTNFATLDTLNRDYSENEDIDKIFEDYYDDSRFGLHSGEHEEDPYYEVRDEEFNFEEWEYLRAYFNHDYQNKKNQIFLLEEPLSYAKRNYRTEQDLRKYIISMNHLFETEDLGAMVTIKI